MSLARLLVRRREPAEARRILGEAHAWFSEGFDTRDLREARVLLAQLEAD